MCSGVHVPKRALHCTAPAALRCGVVTRDAARFGATQCPAEPSVELCCFAWRWAVCRASAL
eukprot:10629860-Alexandrium_andersonii.AAC.1